MVGLVQDLRCACRGLGTRLTVTVIIVATLAVATAINAALFAYLGSFLRPRLDAPQSQRVVWISQGSTGASPSYPDWRDYLEHNEVLSELAIFRLFGGSLHHGNEAHYMWGHLVSADYFSLFAKTPHLGRWLDANDNLPGAERVLVLNYFFWKRNYGGDRNVLGQALSLDGRHSYRVVGVAPPGFQGHGLASSIYIPISHWRDVTGGFDRRDRPAFLAAMGRLRDHLSIEQAQLAFGNLAASLDNEYPLEHPRTLQVEPTTAPDPDHPLVARTRILTAGAALFFLLACSNVTNLFLAATLETRRPMAIHAALGASRLRLVRRILFQSLLLALLGSSVGVALAHQVSNLINRYVTTSMPISTGNWGQGTTVFQIDMPTLLYATSLALIAGLIIGGASAWSLLRHDLAAALTAEVATGVISRRRPRLHRLLVAFQVAVSVVLLLGTILLSRSLWHAKNVEAGFQNRGILLAALYLPRADADVSSLSMRYSRILEEARELPEVAAASLVSNEPYGGARDVTVRPADNLEAEITSSSLLVGDGFFSTLRITLLEGREFDQRDDMSSPGVVIVNRNLAQRMWPADGPLGRYLRLAGDDAPLQVVGVAEDTRYLSLTQRPKPLLYVSSKQRPPSRRMLLIARPHPGQANALQDSLRRSLRKADSAVTVVNLVPIREQERRSLYDFRLHADLGLTIGLLALGLAVTGLFALLSYTVKRRTREIGIRMALGATPPTVVLGVLREAAIGVGVGLGVGLLAAAGLARFLQNLLFGVATNDLVAFLAVPVILTLTALAAAALPARWASRLQPTQTLREP